MNEAQKRLWRTEAQAKRRWMAPHVWRQAQAFGVALGVFAGIMWRRAGGGMWVIPGEALGGGFLLFWIRLAWHGATGKMYLRAVASDKGSWCGYKVDVAALAMLAWVSRKHGGLDLWRSEEAVTCPIIATAGTELFDALYGRRSLLVGVTDVVRAAGYATGTGELCPERLVAREAGGWPAPAVSAESLRRVLECYDVLALVRGEGEYLERLSWLARSSLSYGSSYTELALALGAVAHFVAQLDDSEYALKAAAMGVERESGLAGGTRYDGVVRGYERIARTTKAISRSTAIETTAIEVVV